MVNKGEYMVIYGHIHVNWVNQMQWMVITQTMRKKMGGIDGFSALVIVLLCMIEYDWLGQVMIGELI